MTTVTTENTSEKIASLVRSQAVLFTLNTPDRRDVRRHTVLAQQNGVYRKKLPMSVRLQTVKKYQRLSAYKRGGT